MGLSASAYNLLRYTERKNDVGCQLMRLSTQKQALTRDMQRLSKKYQTEMNTKALKWTTNGGYDYKDLSYATLMSPGALNNSQLYMITDSDGRIVVDSKYRKYAKMISDDGSPRGTYDEDMRNNILGDILGKDPDDIGDAFDAYSAYLDKKAELGGSNKPEPSSKYGYHSSMSSIKRAAGWQSDFDSNDPIESGSAAASFIDSFRNSMKQHFPHALAEFNSLCDNVKSGYSSSVPEDFTKEKLADALVGALSGSSIGGWYDSEEGYNEYQAALAEWENSNGLIEDDMQEAFNTYSSVFDSNTMSQAIFYDKLFSSIAANGWRYYDNLSDPDYLNNMFQNGVFNITTVERTATENAFGGYTYNNEYVTEPILNCKNIVQVNDKDRNNQIYIEYEAERARITAKEDNIDRRMKKLETEQSALKEMIETVKNVMNTNVEKHFNIFNA